MATSTYVALRQSTLSVDATSVTWDLTGVTGYTDLVIVASQYTKFGSAGSAGLFLRFNGSSATNYSCTLGYSGGTTPLSTRASGQNRGEVGQTWTTTSSTTTKFNPAVINIQNYANTTTYKTIIGRSGSADGINDMTVMLWKGATGSSTEAITSIEISTNATTFLAGSTFALYGISKEGSVPAAKATGGMIYADSTYYYHVFPSTSVFAPLSSLTADVLCVAGGGGGGRASGGGGGAGGLTYYASQSLSATNYTVTIGAGGAGSTTGNNENSLPGTSGGNSQFGALTASAGGGGGGSRISNNGTAYYNTSYPNGIAGGSGGGASGNIFSGTNGTAGSATPSGQGNAGGVSFQSVINCGGGGGAGAVGAAATSLAGGNGGAGSSTYSSWLSAIGMGVNVSGTYYIAAGGGGGANGSNAQVQPGTGGTGGGGYGNINSGAGGNATIFTGSGGGGGGIADGGLRGNGGNGASGFVIVRYLKA